MRDTKALTQARRKPLLCVRGNCMGVDSAANQRYTLSTPQRMLVMTAVLPSTIFLKTLATISYAVFRRDNKYCSSNLSICVVMLRSSSVVSQK